VRPAKRTLAFTLAVLFAINFLNFYDRQVLGAVAESIKQEWALSDSQLSALTTAFVLLYAVVGIPLGRLADVGRRKVILAIGIFVWSAFTALSGLATSFAMLFVFRLGVGVGEASAAPIGNSLLGDLFPPEQRARALSVFMLGLPLGTAASYVISGLIVKTTGSWRASLLIAAAPGVVLALLSLLLPEPARGAADPHRRETSDSHVATLRAILRMPTMWWIIASGALMNLNMYALASFTTSFLIRYHGLDIASGNRVSGVIYGVGGSLGLLLGGWIGDRLARWGPSGRLRGAALASLMTAPLVWYALRQPRGEYWSFALFMLLAAAVMYVYYSTVYPSIHDIVAPKARGTALSVYFLVFYVFTAIGLVLFGRLSDAMAARALSAGASAAQSRAFGLHDAMGAIPVISVALALVLFAGSRTAVRDHARLSQPDASP
jgi:predicted MFS family arabinose efflux permease